MPVNVLNAKKKKSATGAKRWILWGSITLFMLFLDQISKIWIRGQLKLGESISIIDPWFRLTYVENRHAIFGLKIPVEWFFLPAAIISIVLIIHYLWRLDHDQTGMVAALGIVTGGALGNILDRFLYNQVTDFIDMGINESWRWYIYNLADAFILIGIVFVFLCDFREKARPVDNIESENISSEVVS